MYWKERYLFTQDQIFCLIVQNDVMWNKIIPNVCRYHKLIEYENHEVPLRNVYDKEYCVVTMIPFQINFLNMYVLFKLKLISYQEIFFSSNIIEVIFWWA